MCDNIYDLENFSYTSQNEDEIQTFGIQKIGGAWGNVNDAAEAGGLHERRITFYLTNDLHIYIFQNLTE